MAQLDWEEKLSALQALTDTCLRMRSPGDWYVMAHGRCIGGDGFLRGSYGNGKTPQEAVEDDWRQMTTHPLSSYIVVGSGEKERRVRWNGFMWVDVPRDD